MLLTTEDRMSEPVQADKKGPEMILVTDASPFVRDIVRAVLSRSGYRVITAADGADAVMKFKQNHDAVHLFITSLFLPEMDGDEAYLAIKDINPRIKALFMVDHADFAVHEGNFKISGVEIIVKPFRADELLNKVRNILG